MDKVINSLPPACYRVTSRAIILVDDKLLIVQDESGWYLPGGGWDFGETFEECLAREVFEETCVAATHIGAIEFSYQQLNSRGYMSLRLAARVEVASTDFKPGFEETGIKLITRDEFIAMKFGQGEGPIHDFVDQIWQTVEN